MKKTVHWMEMKIRGKVRNSNPNQNPIKGARRTCPKLNASISLTQALCHEVSTQKDKNEDLRRRGM